MFASTTSWRRDPRPVRLHRLAAPREHPHNDVRTLTSSHSHLRSCCPAAAGAESSAIQTGDSDAAVDKLVAAFDVWLQGKQLAHGTRDNYTRALYSLIAKDKLKAPHGLSVRVS